jgi:hypothetical protein
MRYCPPNRRYDGNESCRAETLSPGERREKANSAWGKGSIGG